MKASLGRNGAMPRQFVQQLHFQYPKSAESYRSMLNGFWRFAMKDSSRKPLSPEGMRRWLLSRSASESDSYLYNSARLVDRFLDWMVTTGACSANPFAVLKQQYGLKKTRPIVRALLSSNPKRALEELRPLPRFGSFLGAAMRDHVALMKSLGHRYEDQGLLRFDRFLQARPDLSGQPLNTLIKVWSESGSKPSRILEAHRVGQTLSKILRRFDSSAKPFAIDRRAEQLAYRSFRRPYIYTEDEIRRLLKVARTFPSPRAPLRSPTLYMMFILAYCAGLRLGELVRLTLGDIDFRDGTIQICGTKFFKSRRLPLAPWSYFSPETLSDCPS
jgi:site-specific recombinase XerC